MRRKFVPVVWIVLLAGIAGCFKDPATNRISAVDGHPTSHSAGEPTLPASQSTALDSHTRMIRLLKEIEVAVRREGNQYFPEADAARLRAELSALPIDAPPIQKFELQARLGIRELELGNSKHAIEQLSAAYSMIPELRDQFSHYPIRLHMLMGLAYLQKAETDNCVHAHTIASCLFPIRDSGVHQDQEGARKSIPYFAEVLQRDSDDMTARWLLNLAYMLLGEHPDQVPAEYLIPPEEFESKVEFPRFRDVAGDLGVNTFSHCGGVIADDFDGDGWLDLVVSTWNASGQIRFFQNTGNGSFQDRTQEAGLSGILGGLNLVQADYDNDGDLDFLVLRGAWLEEEGRYPNSLLENDGRGSFRDVTFDVGLGDVHYPTQTAAWADFDNDGDLDLYVGNENFPSQLFVNETNGTSVTFRDGAAEAGVENGRKAKAVVWGDYDNDRYPDLYVSNQGHNNRLYHNNGDGTFTDVALRTGVFYPIYGFPAWFWDYDNDGALDISAFSYTAQVKHLAAVHLGKSIDAEPDRLYKGDGTGSFREVSQQLKLTEPTAPMGSNFGDLDFDGYPDFYLGTGYPEYEQLMPNLMYHNRGGTHFDNVTTAGGFGHLQKGHAVAFADFDYDGDQDVFIEMGGAYAGDAFWNSLFENPGFGNHWIALRLVGIVSNRSAIGARIQIEIRDGEELRSVFKWVNSGGSFGCNPLQQQIGLGQAERVESLEVYWPTTGKTDRYEHLAVDQFWEITEGRAAPLPLPLSPSPSHSRVNSAEAEGETRD